MATRVTAIFEKGVLRPTHPLALKEGERVEFTIDAQAEDGTKNEILDRIRGAKSFEEWIAAADEAAKLEPDDGYDLLEALNETRRQAGERLLFSPDRKGIDW